MANTGIFDNDLILPGVITEIVPDYAQDYDTSEFGSTESVTIIGTAFNGPVGKVVPIASPEHAKYIFGDSFDATTRREASLVAEIYDAWDRGCRTIYGIRVSGKEIYNDYHFATETNLKLRVSGIFPSNLNKEVYLNYAANQAENGDAGVIRIYKPVDRANMKEKIQGLVFNESEMLVTDIKLAGYGITKDSRLVDIINIVNEIESNNVIRLSIVDENGADVTASSKEAQSLCLGVMFPGVYVIGRDKVAADVTVKTDIDYVLSETKKPHTNYKESVWTELIVNSDVNSGYPLFAKASNDLSALLPVAADINGEWLKPVGVIDKIAIKNKIDYEEVELDEFDLYQRLGSGYAQTAHIVALKNSSDDGIRGYKVAVPDSNDVNRVVGINDGIYSMLENHSTNYTVLASANAETKITGKLPRKDAFRKRKAGVINLEDTSTPVIELTAKINEKDFSEAKSVSVEIVSVEEGIDQAKILAKLDTSIKAKRVIAENKAALALSEVDLVSSEGEAVVNEKAQKLKFNVRAAAEASKYAEGTIVVEYNDNTYAVKVVKNGQLEAYTEDGVYLIEKAGALVLLESKSKTVSKKNLGEGTSFIATNGTIANVYTVGASNEIKPVSVLGQLANEELEEDYTLCYVEDLQTGLTVKVFSTEAQWMTYGELVDKLNEDVVFSKYFNAIALTPDTEVGAKAEGSGEDKGDIYFDTTMYIPYTTSDNFARHLAQHCVYTSLKTFPTHGIIGCAKLNGVNLSTIADRVNQILALDLDLYAKRSNGNNMLNNNNMPHPIGRCISIPFMQYTVTTGNGYNYVSNGAAGYAGMASTLSADKSSTNQPISLPTLAFELSNYQLSKLTGKGIVTVKNTTNGTVITDGITMAPVDSAYRRLSTSKVINVVDASLREVIAPYIGSQDNLANRNSMNTAITSILNKLKENLISYYKFKIVSDEASARLGIVKIQYTIIPYNEIKEVRNTLSVQETN
mgnify:CR=1 FL=1